MAIIYQTYSIAEAHCKAYITQNKGEADLWVYNVGNRGLAYDNSLWYVTNNRSEATARVFFCSRGISQLIVYFVTNKSEAGWQKVHPMEGRL